MRGLQTQRRTAANAMKELHQTLLKLDEQLEITQTAGEDIGQKCFKIGGVIWIPFFQQEKLQLQFG